MTRGRKPPGKVPFIFSRIAAYISTPDSPAKTGRLTIPLGRHLIKASKIPP